MNHSLRVCLGAALVLVAPMWAHALDIDPSSVAAARDSTALTAPSTQSGEQRIVAILDSATFEIRVLASNFTSKPIARALLRAQGRGVDVQVLVDRDHTLHSDYGSAKRVLGYLVAGGIDVRLSRVSPAARDCAIVVDRHVVQFGAADYSSRGRLDGEPLSVDWDNPALAAEYERSFRHDADDARPLGAQ